MRGRLKLGRMTIVYYSLVKTILASTKNLLG